MKYNMEYYKRTVSISEIFNKLIEPWQDLRWDGINVFEKEETSLTLKEWEQVLRGCRGEEPGKEIGLLPQFFIKINIPFLFCPNYGHLAFKVLMEQIDSKTEQMNSKYITPEETKKAILEFIEDFSRFIVSRLSLPEKFPFSKIGLIRLLLFIFCAYELPINSESLKLISLIIEETIATKSYDRIKKFLNNPCLDLNKANLKENPLEPPSGP